jgi:hypothetical protein
MHGAPGLDAAPQCRSIATNAKLHMTLAAAVPTAHVTLAAHMSTLHKYIHSNHMCLLRTAAGLHHTFRDTCSLLLLLVRILVLDLLLVLGPAASALRA